MGLIHVGQPECRTLPLAYVSGRSICRSGTHAATRMSSVRPPSHITSGCRISTERVSISLRKPYLTSEFTCKVYEFADFVYSCSPVVNLT